MPWDFLRSLQVQFCFARKLSSSRPSADYAARGCSLWHCPVESCTSSTVPGSCDVLLPVIAPWCSQSKEDGALTLISGLGSRGGWFVRKSSLCKARFTWMGAGGTWCQLRRCRGKGEGDLPWLAPEEVFSSCFTRPLPWLRAEEEVVCSGQELLCTGMQHPLQCFLPRRRFWPFRVH